MWGGRGGGGGGGGGGRICIILVWLCTNLCAEEVLKLAREPLRVELAPDTS